MDGRRLQNRRRSWLQPRRPTLGRTTLIAITALSLIPTLTATSPASSLAIIETQPTDNPKSGSDSRDITGTNTTVPNVAGSLVLENSELGARLDVKSPGTTVTGPGMPAWLRQCSGDQWTYLEQEQYFARLSGRQLTSQDFATAGNDPAQIWNYLRCPASGEGASKSPLLASTGIFAVWPDQDRPPKTVLAAIIARSLASIKLPQQYNQAAPVGTPDIPLITQLPTWLWIDKSIWQPVSVTPTPILGISVTATATPTKVVFTGHSEIVDCGANTGPAYNFNLEDHQQHSNCTLTYRHSSNVGTYTLGSTITWATSYQCNQYCGHGTGPNLNIATQRPVTVAEIQAILIG